MAAHMIEQRLQIADPVRHTGDVGVDRDRHHPRIPGPFGIEPVELVAPALQEDVGLVALQRIDGDVVVSTV